MTKLARRGPPRIGVKLALIVHPLYTRMVAPAQVSGASKSCGLAPLMVTPAMVKAVGPRLTMWRTCVALLVLTSCVPKDSMSGMSTMAGGDAAAVELGRPTSVGMGRPLAGGMGRPVAVGRGVAVAVGRGVAVAVGRGVAVAVGMGALVAVGMGALVAVGMGALVAVGVGRCRVRSSLPT